MESKSEDKQTDRMNFHRKRGRERERKKEKEEEGNEARRVDKRFSP